MQIYILFHATHTLQSLLVQVGVGSSQSSPNNLNQMYSVENRDHSKTQAQPVFGLANLALN